MGSKFPSDQWISALYGNTERSVPSLLLTHPEESFYLCEIVRKAKRARICFKVFVFIAVFFLLRNNAFASVPSDVYYAFTEEYYTISKHSFELQSQTNFSMPSYHVGGTNNFDYMQTVWFGVTDRMAVSHSAKWQTVNQSVVTDENQVPPIPSKRKVSYDGFGFKARYRVGEKGKYWWGDPLLLLAWAKHNHEAVNDNEIVGTFVLSKDLGNFNVTYNQIIDSGLGSNGRTQQDFSGGVGYRLPRGFQIGIEINGNYWKPSSNQNELAMGPSFAYESKHFWIVFGSLFAVNHVRDDRDAKVKGDNVSTNLHGNDWETSLTVGIPFFD